MSQTYGLTALIVSHDPNLALFTDRVVAIRDGNTSTETVRYTRRAAIENQGESHTEALPSTDPQKTSEFEELIVLDRAGRLQIPRQYLEMLDIGDRVRLELRDGELLVHPVTGRGHTGETLAAPEELYFNQDQALTGAPGSHSLVERLSRFAGGLSWLAWLRRAKLVRRYWARRKD